jgi:hypothetical protein
VAICRGFAMPGESAFLAMEIPVDRPVYSCLFVFCCQETSLLNKKALNFEGFPSKRKFAKIEIFVVTLHRPS